MEDFPFRDESLPLAQRIRDLLQRLTIEEKVAELTNESASVERLGIPYYDWWNEALHGVARAGAATVFPQAIALAATFDREALYTAGTIIAEEARAKYNKAQRENNRNRYYGLTFWSPNINIFRDPRWGRGHETYGEDPFLTAELGCAFIKGIQQTDGKHLKAAACAKHFAVHSGPEGKRHGFDAVVSKKDLHETYLPAFKAAVQEAKVESVMSAYNRVNGEPCSCSGTLLQDILRDTWGFTGHVVSDCGAVRDIFSGHHYAETETEAAALALKAGCDLNCGSMYEKLTDAYEQDAITEDELDRALERLLQTRMRLGMLDRPENVSYSQIGEEKIACPAHKQKALELAAKAAVLLKNDGILPLHPDKFKNILVTGPNADSRSVLLGNYNGTPTEYCTALFGLREQFGEERIQFCKGSPIAGDPEPALLAEAEAMAAQADCIIACIGLDPSLEGEEGDAYNTDGSGDKPNLALPRCQQALLQAMHNTGKPVIVALFTGSSVNIGEENANAVLNLWYPGEQGGRALASLLTGESVPCGRLPVTFYESTADLPDFCDYSMRNRTYRYYSGKPLYPFGFGLSYTSFSYDNMKAKKTGDAVCVSFTICNTGSYAAEETYLLYVTANGIADAPLRALKAFGKIQLSPGQTETVSLKLPAEAFYLFDENGREYAPACSFTVAAGDTSCQLTF